MANGDPTGGDLCSVTVAADTLPTTPSTNRTTFTFESTAQILDTKKYAIVVGTSGVLEAKNIEWGQKLADGYGGGLKCISDDGGSSWTQVSTRDCDFATKSGGDTKEEYSISESFQACYDPYYIAQTFTATSTYTIDAVELRLRQDWAVGGIDGDVVVSIRQVAGEVYGFYVDATGTVAGSSSITGAATIASDWQSDSVAQTNRLIAIGNNEVWYEDV